MTDLVIDVIAMEAEHHPRHLSIPSSLPKSPLNGIRWTCPGATRWRVRAVYYQIFTSAVAANRVPSLTVRDQNGATVARVAASTTIPAATFSEITFAAGVGIAPFGSVSVITVPIPELILSPGWSVEIDTIAADGGDGVGLANLEVLSVTERTAPTFDPSSTADQ